MIVVAALYRFTRLDDCEELRMQFFNFLSHHQIKGSLILAHEGINGTIAGSRVAIDKFVQRLSRDTRFNGVEYKESFADINPFKRLKVKVKPEIVTLGRPHMDIEAHKGNYVNSQEWNVLVKDPGVTVLDVRNGFEVEMGSFQNARNPKTQTFREFVDFVQGNLSPDTHKKIAMSCTGGIRCEKASAYMKELGFQEVYHLKGGILQYLADTPKENSLWQGECFVFDERIAVDHDLKARAGREQ